MAIYARRHHVYHPGAAIATIIDILFGIIEVFLGLRFILKLFGANPLVQIVQWIDNAAGALMAPFFGIFPSVSLGGRFTIELTTLFAMIVYGLVRWLLIAVVAPRSHNDIVD